MKSKNSLASVILLTSIWHHIWQNCSSVSYISANLLWFDSRLQVTTHTSVYGLSWVMDQWHSLHWIGSIPDQWWCGDNFEGSKISLSVLLWRELRSGGQIWRCQQHVTPPPMESVCGGGRRREGQEQEGGVKLMWRIVFKGMLGLGVGGNTTVTVSTICIPEKSIVSTNTNYDMMLPVLDY